MLRTRVLTGLVVGLAVALQAWGVAAGVVPRNTAGMQVAVYLLTLALATLQADRIPTIAALHPLRRRDDITLRPATAGASAATAPAADAEDIPAVIRVSGVDSPRTASAPAPTDSALQALTRREREVVVLAVQGFTAREIGTRLFIGERTVETHLGNAYGKLGVRSKLELVRVTAGSAAESADFRTGTEASRQATA
jgi:DNA-binding CsgD family transcriptional regulator